MKIIIPFLILNLSVSIFGETKKMHFFGTATDLESGKILYYDHHEEIWENGNHSYSRIQYKNPQGKVFAKKKIQFSKNPSIPDFQLDDLRDGYLEGGTFLKSGSAKLFARRNSEKPLEEKTISFSEPASMDGGFDYFVKNNWESLIDGKTIRFRFLVPVERDTFAFSVFKTKTGEYKGKPALFLRMKIDNALFSVFVKPIDMVYDIESRRIMEYKGTSNINDEKGKSLNVKIVYDFR
ncbi:hypothetical protein JWG45_06020 [Leptospira sp. 201903070]|uniref:DUF3108 domain-containing protein n=1 Tax=Leptospira ainlahdjerensis TaxID=2810033 RepID=A0ABS2UAA6_9LEPT|nr:hypothetical protein [Leptospira ainlahdjerensis]MBM9576709.1 hypothetical protein [Leptospira ainlahdjerensis]